MKLGFIGADHEVTGSCHYVEACNKRILVDCGLEQGRDIYVNQDIPVPVHQIDYVLLTHAHIDHSGRLPLLYKNGFKGEIISTFATSDLCSIMLRDSAHIQEFEAEWRNRKGKRSGAEEYVPLYTMKDALGAIDLFHPCGYEQKIDLCTGIQVRFRDIGHLLGSASIELWISEDGIQKKLVFSGDIGNINQPLIKDPKATDTADYVIMEATYGDRNHNAPPDYVAELAGVIAKTLKRGGNLVIPSFAVGRTQELLYFIREIKERKLIDSDFPVYVDSPLAIEATSIFNKNVRSCFDEEALELVNAGINPIRFSNLHLAVSSEESKAINFDAHPKVIISASGMCEAGRIKHHLKHNLWRPECTVLFVGYQACGTLGRSLIEGIEYVKLFGETIEVKSEITRLEGISGHADMNGLLDWLSGFKETPQHVFVVHGEDSVTDEFAQTVTERFGCPAMAPYSGGCVDLATGEILTAGVPVRKASVKPVDVRKKTAFQRVVSAAKRLLEVVYRNEGLANKELAKFETQIHNLADKWDR